MLADWPLIARRLVRRLGGDADNGDGGLCVLALLHCCTMTNDDCARKEEEVPPIGELDGSLDDGDGRHRASED